ncbi:MAG: hypothetical protein HYU64_08640 [Armatimonadetes bacterium]|nr:hypothetical protein [Armatimonadota bacterium]
MGVGAIGGISSGSAMTGGANLGQGNTVFPVYDPVQILRISSAQAQTGQRVAPAGQKDSVRFSPLAQSQAPASPAADTTGAVLELLDKLISGLKTDRKEGLRPGIGARKVDPNTLPSSPAPESPLDQMLMNHLSQKEANTVYYMTFDEKLSKFQELLPDVKELMDRRPDLTLMDAYRIYNALGRIQFKIWLPVLSVRKDIGADDVESAIKIMDGGIGNRRALGTAIRSMAEVLLERADLSPKRVAELFAEMGKGSQDSMKLEGNIGRAAKLLTHRKDIAPEEIQSLWHTLVKTTGSEEARTQAFAVSTDVMMKRRDIRPQQMAALWKTMRKNTKEEGNAVQAFGMAGELLKNRGNIQPEQVAGLYKGISKELRSDGAKLSAFSIAASALERRPDISPEQMGQFFKAAAGSATSDNDKVSNFSSLLGRSEGLGNAAPGSSPSQRRDPFSESSVSENKPKNEGGLS